MRASPATACAAAATNPLRVQEALTGGTGREETKWFSSTLVVVFWLARSRAEGRALVLRNHRPVAFPTVPPRPRLGAEVTDQPEQEDTERGNADDQ